MMKLLVGLAFIGIIGSLASALVIMMKPGRQGEADDPRRAGRMVKALALRVTLSIALFICVLLAWKFGWIRPSGLPLGQ